MARAALLPRAGVFLWAAAAMALGILVVFLAFSLEQIRRAFATNAIAGEP